MLCSFICKLQLPAYYKTGKSNVEADTLSQIPWQKAKSECQDLDYLTIKAIIVSCTTETPLIEAYARKTVICPQEDTLPCNKMDTDQNSLITNQVWREWQIKIKLLLKSKPSYRMVNWVSKKDLVLIQRK